MGATKTQKTQTKKAAAAPKPKKQAKPRAPRKVAKALAKATARNVPARFVSALTTPGQKQDSSVASAPSRQMTRLAATVEWPNGKPASASQFRSTHVEDGAHETTHVAQRMSPNDGIGRMNRQGTEVERIQQNHKNLRPDPVGVKSERKAERFLEKNMNAQDLLSPDALRYCNLLDDPLNAPWGDEGEVAVRPLVYTETVPPSTTKTIRCFGQQELSIPAGQQAWVMFCIGAGNSGDLQQDQGDTLGVAQPVYVDAGNPLFLVTPGAPNDGRGSLISPYTYATPTFGAGNGCAGWYYCNAVSSNPPSIQSGRINDAAPALPPRHVLFWGSPVPFGDMVEDDSSAYKYRPVAGGILITPDETTFELGGHYDAMVVPQATNDSYVTASEPDRGKSVSIADVLALPDHCIQRADDAITVNWLPGRQDYSFLKSYPSADVQTLHAADGQFFVDSPNCRVMVLITPPQNANPHTYVLSYTGFYEVAGQCVQQVGSVPRAAPTVGAKIATSVQNNLNIELDDRSRQVTEGTTLEVMKDHPKIGPMIEGCDSMPKAKSTLSEIMDFGKELLPLVGMML
jgi:hypothetical protein